MRSGLTGQVRGHAPVGDVGVIEGRLEWLVFDEQALAGVEMVMGGAQGFLKPADALANALRAGIVGTVGQPQGDVAAPEPLGDLDGIQNVVYGLFADLRRGVAQGTELVLLVLKQVRIDGPGAQCEAALQFLHLGDIGDAVRQIPQYVESEGGGHAGKAVYLGCVGELFLDGGGGGCLDELAKARTGVGESPGGNLDLERVQRLNSQVEGSGF